MTYTAQPGRNDPPGLPIFLAFLGLVNLVMAGAYFARSWSTMHEQGLGHLYLGLAAAFGSWWLAWVSVVCFAGIAAFASERSGIGLRRIAYTAAGLAIGYYAPQYLLAVFFIVAAWIHALL